MCTPAGDESTSVNTAGPRCVAVFDSIHHVLAAEKGFKRQAVWCDLVPTPRKISSDCGMVLEFRAQDLDEAREVLTADSRVKVKSVYRVAGGTYEAVSL